MKGALLYAHNNGLIDYGSLALFCSLLFKKQIKDTPVTLVTDDPTWQWLQEMYTPKSLTSQFDDHIIIPSLPKKDKRKYWDSSSFKEAPYLNTSKPTAFSLSKYDETLVLDVDYLMFDPSLNSIWGSSNDMMMNYHTMDVGKFTKGPSKGRVSSISMLMYWATIFYFRKTKRTERFFETLQQINVNFDYYGLLYNYNSNMFRNDYSFSVANHVLSGYAEADSFIKPLPVSHLLTAGDRDNILSLNDSQVIFEALDVTEKAIPCRINSNVHCMSKMQLQKQVLKLLRPYKNEKN